MTVQESHSSVIHERGESMLSALSAFTRGYWSKLAGKAVIGCLGHAQSINLMFLVPFFPEQRNQSKVVARGPTTADSGSRGSGFIGSTWGSFRHCLIKAVVREGGLFLL